MSSKKKVDDSDAPKPVSGAAKNPLKPNKLLTNSLLIVFIVLLLGFLWYQNGSERRDMTALAEMIARETGDNYEMDKLFDCGVENERTCPSIKLSKKIGSGLQQEANAIQAYLLQKGLVEERSLYCNDGPKMCSGAFTKNDLEIGYQSADNNIFTIYVSRK